MGTKTILRFLLIISFMGLLYGTCSAQNSTGYLKFNFNTDSAYVVIGNDYYTAEKVASGDSLELASGSRMIKLFTPFEKTESNYFWVYADSTVSYSFKFNRNRISPESISGNIAARYHFDANIMVLTDEDSEIYYNGTYMGIGFAAFNAPEEIGRIEFKNPDFGTFSRRVNVKERQVTYVENYNRPIEGLTKIYSIFPGLSQAYKKQHLKAVALGIGTAGLITFAALRNAKYHNEMDVFYEYKTEYENAETEEHAFRLGDLTERQHDKVTKIDNQRKFLLISGLLVYAYNIYDGITNKPNGGYAKQDKDLEFYLSQEHISGNFSPSGTLRFNF